MVVHSHLLEHELLPLWMSGSKEFGREAVIIFFVMSGYVIAYTTAAKKHSWQEYFVARAARIYSVAAPIILLATIIGCVGINLSPEKYQDFYQYEKLYFYIPFHFLFLGEISIFYEKPFLVVPYWSLSYEVWYYVIFGCCFFITGKLRYLIISLLILLVGFRLLLLAPIWYAGVGIYHYRDRLRISSGWAQLLLAASFLLFVFYAYSGVPDILRNYAIEYWPSGLPKLGSAERFLSDYIYTLIITLNFIAVASIKWSVERFRKSIGVIRSLASYTFTLYLSHMLVIEPVVRHLNGYQHNPFASLLTIVCIACVTWIIGMVTEKRKAYFADLFLKILVLARLNPKIRNEVTVEKNYGAP